MYMYIHAPHHALPVTASSKMNSDAANAAPPRGERGGGNLTKRRGEVLHMLPNVRWMTTVRFTIP